MRKLTLCGILAGAIVSLGASTAMAGAWSNPSGTAHDFSYSNGGDLHGRFGDPVVIGNVMSFPYVTFQANSPLNGFPATDGDTVSWDMQINGGMSLCYVRVWAFGSYTLAGVGSSVDADMTTAITEIPAPHRVWTDHMMSAPEFPLVNAIDHTAGAWYGISEQDLSGLVSPPRIVHVDLTTMLQAMASAYGGAEINTQYQELRVEWLLYPPEPATLALLAIVGLARIRRR